jgi:hypothetical protein
MIEEIMMKNLAHSNSNGQKKIYIRLRSIQEKDNRFKNFLLTFDSYSWKDRFFLPVGKTGLSGTFFPGISHLPLYHEWGINLVPLIEADLQIQMNKLSRYYFLGKEALYENMEYQIAQYISQYFGLTLRQTEKISNFIKSRNAIKNNQTDILLLTVGED